MSSRFTMLFYWIIPVHVPCTGQGLKRSRFSLSFILKNICLSINPVTKLLVFWNSFYLHLAPRVAWWVRCCSISRTVPWSIPSCDTEFFSDILLSDHTKSLGSTQHLVKSSSRNIREVRAAGVWDLISHHLHAPNIMKILESKPPGTLWATPGL